MQSGNGTFDLVVGGDAILTRRISQFSKQSFVDLVEAIRTADASVVNLEGLLHDFEGYPSENGAGTYMRFPPWVADELEWAGFNLFSLAHNHAMDYSHGGMEATMRELEKRDLPYAGMGRNLTEARSPAYFDSPAGRVSLVAATSTFPVGSSAGRQTPNLQGRPGISPLDLDTTYEVTQADYERMQDLSERLGLEAVKQKGEDLGLPLVDPSLEEYHFLDVDGNSHISFDVGDETRIRREANDDHLEEILDQIEAANRQADWVVASVHTHEGSGAMFNDRSVPSFLQNVAKRCIDAGADVFMGHGPHILRGIELYERRPIFYSLGDLFFENETIPRLPAEMYDRYDVPHDAPPADVFDARLRDENGNANGFIEENPVWRSVLPYCSFADGELKDVRLLPLDLQQDCPRPQRGRPVLAEEPLAREILERLQELSGRFGTEIEIVDGEGQISP